VLLPIRKVYPLLRATRQFQQQCAGISSADQWKVGWAGNGDAMNQPQMRYT
jgi:hypothetical protein